MLPQPEKPDVNDKLGVFLVPLMYLGFYLLGVLACVMLTPVDFILAGKALWHLYPLLAIVGFFFYFSLSPAYTFGHEIVHWLVGLLGVSAVVLGVLMYFEPLQHLRFLSPLLIGFSIGFVGTLGMFYTAAASI